MVTPFASSPVNDFNPDDFLKCVAARLGTFDAIVMNPPFKMGTDIKHIRHALTFLEPGGRLLSLCANGPKQRAALKAEASEWIDLPAGSFSNHPSSDN